jgi:hypothetical protein
MAAARRLALAADWNVAELSLAFEPYWDGFISRGYCAKTLANWAVQATACLRARLRFVTADYA